MGMTFARSRLGQRYKGLKSLSTRDRSDECGRLAENPGELVDEFCEALRDMEPNDNRTQPFHPDGRKCDPVLRGARMYLNRLQAGTVSVPALEGYEFLIMDYEIGPRRATGAGARASVAGGIDYVALSQGTPRVPILGEIKVGNDKDTFYAFVQLLYYLSEMSSEAQVDRANRHLFGRAVCFPAKWDLHILLCDFNDRGEKGPIVEETYRLAKAFCGRLGEFADARARLGRVLCLGLGKSQSGRTLELIWHC